MDLEIQMLLKGIETGDLEEKTDNLLDIGDYIEHVKMKPEDFREIVQQLIKIVSYETDWKVKKQIFRTLSLAYTQQVSLEEISFEPLLNNLEKAEPLFIRNVLYLLSMTHDRKYIPLIMKYADHPDEKLKEEALELITFFDKL